LSALDWSESMSGRVSFDTTDYNQGWWQGTHCAFHLDLHVDDVERFFADDEHEATCTGWQCSSMEPGPSFATWMMTAPSSIRTCLHTRAYGPAAKNLPM